jgi:hypothetical protein
LHVREQHYGHAGRTTIRMRTDDYFFTAMSLLILGTVFLGFAHSYYLAGTVHARLPNVLVHIHGAIFSCWILLLIAQTTLVSAGKVGWHKKLGILGAFLAYLMVVFGALLIVDTIRRHHIPRSLTPGILLALDLGQLSVFAVLVTGGVRVRRQGAAHKRLMLLSTIAILFSAVARWHFSFIRSFSQVGLIIDGFLLCMIVFDLLTQRRIHRVTIWGSLMISSWCRRYLCSAVPLSGSVSRSGCSNTIERIDQFKARFSGPICSP